jgi:branched-chain amino acid transport system substrate-binding protein
MKRPYRALNSRALALPAMALAALALGATAPKAQAQQLQIAIPAELTGSGASVGVLWRDGAEMAIDDINAKGGILGHKLASTAYDTQTNPSVSRAVIQKALDGHPYAVLGPVYSGSVKVDEALTQQAGITEIMGGVADDLTKAGDPTIFRTTLAQSLALPPAVTYMKDTLHAKKVAMVWVNDDYGIGGHKAMQALLKDAGMELVVDDSSEAGQVSFAPDILKIRAAKPDVIFVYLHEEENARLMKALVQNGIKAPVMGGTVTDQQTIKLAGDAASGALSIGGLDISAPVPAIADFHKRFVDRFHVEPDHNALQAYMGMWMIKAGTEKMGKADAQGLAAALHGMTITPDQQPGIMVPMHILANGDVDNGALLTTVKDGQQVVLKVIPPAQ